MKRTELFADETRKEQETINIYKGLLQNNSTPGCIIAALKQR